MVGEQSAQTLRIAAGQQAGRLGVAPFAHRFVDWVHHGMAEWVDGAT
jgi:hypothetical protein